MINEYFSYIDDLIKNDKNISYDDKDDIRRTISFFKVTGYIDELDLIISCYDNYDMECQLYVLFEYISMKIYDVKDYINWVKEFDTK